MQAAGRSVRYMTVRCQVDQQEVYNAGSRSAFLSLPPNRVTRAFG